MERAETDGLGHKGKLPLAVDLDGTLIRSDSLEEAVARLLVRAPWRLVSVGIAWLRWGRARAKALLFRGHGIQVESLPYDRRVLDWLQGERRGGRVLVLATGTDQQLAVQVADHLRIFDAVFASDGEINLKGNRKAECLANAFPEGFAYAGNSRSDLPIWKIAREAVVINASEAVARKARSEGRVVLEFPRIGRRWALLEAMRPHQWIKNILVSVPIVTGQGWGEAEAWRGVLLAFGALCLLASAVYLGNDVADLDPDRAHPRKRHRPMASGDASPLQGLALAFGLAAGGLGVAWCGGILGWAVLYLALTLAYNFGIKRLLLVDVFGLAFFYALRILMGGQASGFLTSDWLVAFSAFFFLSLALGKRVAEIGCLSDPEGRAVPGRAYVRSDGPALLQMGVASGYVSCLVLALYLQDRTVLKHYEHPAALWGVCAVLLFWISRTWLLICRGTMQDEPVQFAIRDRWSWACGGVALGCLLVASGQVPLAASFKFW
jgi:4-hydroxybenzoate polyprenyltransferase/phosphoserine phosphatase